MRFYTKIICLLLLLHTLQAHARNYFKDKPDFIERNLKRSCYDIDTSAAAVVLYEKYDFDLSGGRNIMTFKVRRVIKILKKSGISNADINVVVYHIRNRYSKISKISGTTYNLDSGVVTTQKLDADNTSSGTYDKIKEKKFSMPSVHEGSIIDYTFEMEIELSRSFGRWDIEAQAPKLYSETELIFPATMKILTLQQRVHEFAEHVDEKVDSLLPDAYIINEASIGRLYDKRYVRRNIKAITKEPYIYNINNFKEQMSFYIDGVENGITNDSYSWEKANDILLTSDDYYKAITKKDREVSGRADALTSNLTEDLQKAMKIYAFVRDSVRTNGEKGIQAKKAPGEVLADKAGSEAEVNMLLATMLRSAGITCDPLVLSTRDNGRVSELYPDLNRFNYTICAVIINDKTYYLDASGRYNPFGVLSEKCYNGYARVIAKHGRAAILSPNNAREIASYKIATDNNSDTGYVLSVTCAFGTWSGLHHRQKWNTDSAELKDYISNLFKDIPLSLHLKSYEVQNMKDPDSPLVLVVHASTDWRELNYLDPYLYKYFSKNPLINESRQYPVEMPYVYDITCTGELRLPAGYSIEDTLAPSKGNLDYSAIFTNSVKYNRADNILSVSAHFETKKTQFPTEDYPSLKYFFDKLIASQQKTLAIKKL